MIPVTVIVQEYLRLRRANPFLRPVTAWSTARFIVGMRLL